MIQYRPIVQWPGELTPDNQRLPSPFNTPWGKTLSLLQRELDHLGAENVVFQVAVNENDIRLDGGLKAGRLRYHPGVIITFDSKLHGPLSYHTDQYAEFTTNVRAIALALEALRKVDRYGVNKAGTQYAGYKRLPPAGESTNGRKHIATPEEAAAFIEKHFPEVTANQILSSSPLFETAYRQAARKLHPDANPGHDDEWIDLQEAAAILKRRHGA